MTSAALSVNIWSILRQRLELRDLRQKWPHPRLPYSHGIVGNRWVKDQEAYIVRVGESIYKISWTEPTGTDVSLIVNLGDKLFHGHYFLPRAGS
ncbi:phenolic acid decarboxylase [Klebsiella pneumoniae]|uniref:Phenolic acid decarboxylase n=1 Tax=Klebsiella pneumoniae TaxID=573 RepID=A0A377VW60_KLEPN|nr:phenolic acid decarboxylase [Klebsiella pneumoniae]